MPSWLTSCFKTCCSAPYRASAEAQLQAAAVPANTAVPRKSTAAATPEGSSHNQFPDPQAAQAVQELSQLGDVMRVCSGIPGSSYNQLGRICAILAEHFKVAYVSASVLSSTGITCLPVVAGGRLARLCPLGLPQFLDASQASSFYLVTGQQRFLCRRVPGDELPPDWEALREASGLAAFLAAAIAVGSETVAILTMADDDPDKFASPMWRTSLELVGAFMGHLFRDRQLAGYCGVVEELMAVDSLDDLIRTLSRCVVRLHQEKFHQMRLTCRIACVATDASSAIIFDEALPYASVLASGVVDDVSGPAVPPPPPPPPPPQPVPPGIASHPTARHPLLRASTSIRERHASGSGGGEAHAGHPAAPGWGMHTPRGRFTRLSLMYPSPAGDLTMALQYQVQMHSMANLVPDPVDLGPGSPALPPPPPSGPTASSAILPVNRLQSTGGAAGALASGEGGGGGKPPPLLRGVGTSLSQPGLYGGGGGLTGDPARDAALWNALDPGAPSNFSQQQLQVEGQTYLLENTLLAEAIANRAGVWIGDCVAFMQNPNNPNADVFLAATAHHTTAMMLAVMWERSGGHCGLAQSGQQGVGGGARRPSGCRHHSMQQFRRPSGRLANAGSGGLSGQQVQRQPSAGDAYSPFLTQSTSLLAPPPREKAHPQPQGPAASNGGGTGGGSGGSGPPAALRDSCDTANNVSPNPPSPPGFVVGPSGCGSPTVRGTELPLLAFYLLTSRSASPMVLEELLVHLRELLVVLEPLVSSKLADDLSGEWLQLQREVLDKSKVIKQPKDRTIVLRNTAAQLVLNSVDDASSFVSDAYRPSSARVQHLSRYTSGSATVTPAAPSAAPAAAPGPPVGGGSGAAVAIAAEALMRSAPDALRSVSERALALGPATNSPGGPGMGIAAATAAGPAGARVRTPSLMLMSRSFTGKRISALISGVQDRVQQAQRMSVSYNTMFNRPDDLRSITMLEKLGSGGFGTVYLGMYQSTEVAVKVIMERDCETEVLRNAVELAVLSTLSHPNIVQVLTFFTDVTVQIPPIQARISGAAPPIYLFPHEPSTVQLDLTPVASAAMDPMPPPDPLSVGGSKECSAASAGGVACGGNTGGAAGPAGAAGGVGPIAAAAGPARPASLAPAAAQAALVQRQPSASQPPKKALVILMEFCDAGCLADAIRNGVFRERVKGGYGALQPAWSNIYLTLLEVAQALRYLHSLNLVHRDVKPQNVLLKSSPSDVRGFTAKLSDFGLVKLLTEADIVASAAAAASTAARRPRRYSGTITHVAPEAMRRDAAGGAGGGSVPVDVSVDIYAFGIVMWEIVTGEPVYLGLNSDQIMERVRNEGLRPAFSHDTPMEYSALANRCWDMDPRRRPTSEDLVQQMSALSSASRNNNKVLAARRRMSTLSNKELLRNVANANLAAANAAANAAGAGASGHVHLPVAVHAPLKQRYNEDDFPLHIL